MNNSVWKTVDSSAWESPSKAGTVPYRALFKRPGSSNEAKVSPKQKITAKSIKRNPEVHFLT